jgi:zinc protease
MRTEALAALLALGAPVVGACYHPPPLDVPGPTTAHPPGYSLVDAPLPPASPVRGISLEAPGSNVVAIRVVFASGSADDPPGKEGLTRLTAKAMAEGGTAKLSFSELTRKLYPLAASITAEVDRDETVFSAEVTRDSAEAFLPLFADVLLSPRLDAEGFARVHARAVSALTDDLRGADDEALGKEALEAFVYQGHPYGHPPVGTEKGLGASSLEDVKAHRARVFCRERATVGVAGDLPPMFSAKATAALVGLPGCEGERASLPAPRKLTGLNVLVVDKPSADSTAISVGYAYDVTRSHPDFPAVAFFADYLGLHRQSTGRLYQELREKRGLNYGDYAYAEHFDQEGDSSLPRPNVARRQQLFSLWLRPVKPADATFALRAALREYGGLLEHGVSGAEIARYRTFLTRFDALEELTASRRVGYALDDLSYGLSAPYLQTMHAGFQALDDQKLGAALKRHLTAKDLAIVIVAHDGAALAASLAAGAPTKAPKYAAPKPASVTAADLEIVRYPLPVAPAHVKVVAASEIFKD